MVGSAPSPQPIGGAECRNPNGRAHPAARLGKRRQIFHEIERLLFADLALGDVAEPGECIHGDVVRESAGARYADGESVLHSPVYVENPFLT
jgi:hypothetical protein